MPACAACHSPTGAGIPKNFPKVSGQYADYTYAQLKAFKSGERMPDENSVVYFVGIDGARFKSPVGPGDQLLLHARIDRHLKGIWKFSTEARVGERLAAEAKLMCALRDA